MMHVFVLWSEWSLPEAHTNPSAVSPSFLTLNIFRLHPHPHSNKLCTFAGHVALLRFPPRIPKVWHFLHNAWYVYQPTNRAPPLPVGDP